MSTAASRLLCLTRLQRHLLAASAAASLTACPATDVRPGPSRCPSEALATMRQLRLKTGTDIAITLDINNPEPSKETNYGVPVRDGEITSRTWEAMNGLPEGTLLHGRLWTGGEMVVGRYTRARTPDGSEHAVCLYLGDGDGWPKNPRSRPGYTLLHPNPFVTVVDRFP